MSAYYRLQLFVDLNVLFSYFYMYNEKLRLLFDALRQTFVLSYILRSNKRKGLQKTLYLAVITSLCCINTYAYPLYSNKHNIYYGYLLFSLSAPFAFLCDVIAWTFLWNNKKVVFLQYTRVVKKTFTFHMFKPIQCFGSWYLHSKLSPIII